MIRSQTEAMLAGLAIVQPRLANEITVVSLLPVEAFRDELRRAGVTVVEFDFSSAKGIASKLVRLARLISAQQPDIVQG